VRQTWGDISAARAALGYEPKTDFAEGVRRMAAWLRDHAQVSRSEPEASEGHQGGRHS
jgi:nucleoside-diphosphate-sugar epimerase